MQYVTRMFTPNLWSSANEDLSVVSLTREDLADENEGYEDFAETVWDACEKHGWYNDSDLPDTFCIYVKGRVQDAN